MSCDTLQRITVATTFFIVLLCFMLSLPILIVLLIFGNWYVRAICLVYLLFYLSGIIRKVTDRGGRRPSQWLRNWGLWRWLVNYFPVDLVKTADLPPDRNYLVCIFPHGYLSIGAMLNFASNYSKWPTLFPGTRPRLTTIVMNYYFPLSRELYLSLGMSTCSKESLTALLKQSNDSRHSSNRDGFTSNAVGLIVGGEREQRMSDRDSYKFVLKTRKGFARIALKTGSPLVPLISFGENNTFDVARWKFRFNGRVPITSVVGAPIYVEENPNPTEDEVSEIHAIFCRHIKELFDEHKSKYIENYENVELEFV